MVRFAAVFNDRVVVVGLKQLHNAVIEGQKVNLALLQRSPTSGANSTVSVPLKSAAL